MNEPAHAQNTLQRAREAAARGERASMHIYYATHLSARPDDGAALAEYLEHARRLARGGEWKDAESEGRIGRLLGTSAPAKVLDAALERLKTNPHDLEAVGRIGRAAMEAGWLATAAAAFTDVLKHSVAARAKDSALGRELRVELGRARYRQGAYEQALKLLLPFQDCAPADIAQMIKDASAHLATGALQGKDALRAATEESRARTAESPGEKLARDLEDLEALLDDEQADAGKRCTAALKAADGYVRLRRFDPALSALRRALALAPGHGDLEKRLLEVELRRFDHRVKQLSARGGADLDARERLLAEREAHAARGYGALARKLPADGEVHLELARALFAQWKRRGEARDERGEDALKVAAAHLQFEFKAEEQHHAAKLLLAQCFVALGLPAAAEALLAEFAEDLKRAAGPHGAVLLEAQYLLGTVREQTGDAPGALRAYLAVVAKDINYRDALARLRRVEPAKPGVTAG